MNVLVTGGAGFVGSHTAKELHRCGFGVVAMDNLKVGRRKAVRWGPLVEGGIQDTARLREAIRHYGVGAVVHLAADANARESAHLPRQYYETNVVGTLAVLDAMLTENVKRVVFASSCSVYGNLKGVAHESAPSSPISPYGETKLFCEEVLRSYEAAYGLSWVAMRYFNVAGADPEGEIGEDHDPETHIIPKVILNCLGAHLPVEVLGVDHGTEDGTAVRDYVHVGDVASANRLALQHLLAGGASGAVNIGSGVGSSVRQIVAAVEASTGAKASIIPRPRHEGDPSWIVADAARARAWLGWTPRNSSLGRIVGTAHSWLHSHGPAPRAREPLSVGEPTVEPPPRRPGEFGGQPRPQEVRAPSGSHGVR